MTIQRIQLAIKADAAQVWGALTDGATTPAYYFGFSAEFGDLTPGAAYRYTAGGGDMITGRVLAARPGAELTTTFNGHWTPAVDALPESTVTFRVAAPDMPMPGVSLLTCLHEGLPDSAAAADLEQGWVTILSGLKTLLETGAPLVGPPAA